MSEITITIPEIQPAIIQELETLDTHALATEVEAVRLLREKYSPLATYNGYVKLGYWCCSTENYTASRDYFLEREAKRVKAFRAYDGFTTEKDTELTGFYTGERLFLLE